MTPVGTAEALAVLLASCLNISPRREWHAERAWSRLTTLARNMACYRMEYGSPQEGAATLADLLTCTADGVAGRYSRATLAKKGVPAGAASRGVEPRPGVLRVEQDVRPMVGSAAAAGPSRAPS